ncbi:hypothetical protein RJZ57_008535, partial [Blastomyces gilchristii]
LSRLWPALWGKQELDILGRTKMTSIRSQSQAEARPRVETPDEQPEDDDSRIESDNGELPVANLDA